MSIEVLAPGPLTTVQDLGRRGHRHVGVPLAGALDPGAAMVANWLVGNDGGAALLEFTLAGPALRFDRPARMALTGATAEAWFTASDGTRDRVPHGRPVTLPAGDLQVSGIRSGARGWLAVGGGVDVPVVLGSRATDLRGGFGGMHGRALRRGDRLALLDPPPLDVAATTAPGWWVDPHAREPHAAPIRFVPAPGTDRALLRGFASGYWQVATDSNRQGVRLQGHALGSPGAGGASAPVAAGTVQLPPDGQPIVLMADAQTMGGYLRLGHVASADLHRLAQAAPGATLRFRPCTASHARRLAAAASARLARLRLALETRR